MVNSDMTLLSLKNAKRPWPGRPPVSLAGEAAGRGDNERWQVGRQGNDDGVDWDGLNHGVDQYRRECPGCCLDCPDLGENILQYTVETVETDCSVRTRRLALADRQNLGVSMGLFRQAVGH